MSRIRFDLAALLTVFVSLVNGQGSLRIASFNIENLGVRKTSSSEPADFPQKPSDLAKYIGDSKADLLSLQEIHDTDQVDETRTNETLEETLNLLNQAGGNWAHLLLSKKRESSTSQLLAVAWNRNRVELVGRPLTIAVPDRVPHRDAPSRAGFNVFDRGLHALKFRAKDGASDFVLIPVHLKSNVGSGTTTQRGIEAEILLDSLPEIREQLSDKDIVVAGDTNIKDDSEPAIKNFTASGFTDLNEEQATFVTGAEFDRFLVPDRPLFANSEMKVFQSGFALGDDKEHEKRLSDHLLVFIDILVDDADDPTEDTDEAEDSVENLNIIAVLPDPIGRDSGRETLTIGNPTEDTVSLANWQCIDRAGNKLSLSGTIEANGTHSITASEDFALNNNGDAIRLVAPNGTVVDTVEYDADQVERGRFIVFQP